MLDKFLAQVQADVFDAANDPDSGGIRLTALLRVLLDRLSDVDAVPESVISFYISSARNAEVHGYAYDSDEDILLLYFCIDACEDVRLGDPASVTAVGKDLVDRAFRRLEAFLKLVRSDAQLEYEESQPVAELIELLREPGTQSRLIELHVITNGTVSERAAISQGKSDLTREVWDLNRLFRTCGANDHEKLTVNFEADYGTTLPCLVTDPAPDGIQVLLTTIPGPVLASIYNTYRSRLLERNVRSFLQFTGKVNKGIRDTILSQPDRFLPYNNGLSATASSVELENIGGNLARIRSVGDFQIVNGGQTTASIASTFRRGESDLSSVTVAMKLTIVPPGKLDQLVPSISKYANTQNRIQEADFSANHPWHIALQTLSRNTWTSPTPEAPRGTRWFYERSRGQYSDECAAQGTPAGRRRFRTENPPAQKFTKTDLAKFCLSWDQKPAIVSRGAQKCFMFFMDQILKEGRHDPELPEYRRIVALAILFHSAEKLYGELGLQGYRAQVVTYAVARLSQMLQCRLPFDEIWEKQQLPSEVTAALKILLIGVRDEITEKRPPNTNVTEWCKKEGCWSAVLQRSFQVELPGVSQDATYPVPPNHDASAEERVLVERIKQVPADVWFSVAKWAKDTSSLYPGQRAIAFSIGQIVARGGSPTPKQSKSGFKLLHKARELGFGHPSLKVEHLQLASEASKAIEEQADTV